jgi:hypothetical protein
MSARAEIKQLLSDAKESGKSDFETLVEAVLRLADKVDELASKPSTYG